MTGGGQLQSGNLGFIIAAAILLGLGGVACMMFSLFVANLRQSAKARELAAQARGEARQRMSASRAQDIGALLDAASAQADGKAIRLDIQLPQEAVCVFAIEAELRELLAKVTAYAASVMRAGTTLQVSAHADGEQAVVHWRDLDAVDAHPPLARFFDGRLPAAMAASAKACERIAGHHGGRIYSAPHGGGVLGLTLRLPLLRA
ncbi:ATP-binding protein [Variovorax guangxiensis]|uniref:ATP-binding protein n=1 Tax=Variovorax guangxiensis TaxID=1775474 RepID=UPI00198040F9|nr:ATP-binding protein [Variovorax guangxiensis]